MSCFLKNTGFIPSGDWRREEGRKAREQPEVAKQNPTLEKT
jgi:hypothetical protein